MKRMLITAAVSAIAAMGAFAVPANAQDTGSVAITAAPCGSEPIVPCAQRIIATLITIGGPCRSGEPLTTCVQRILKNVNVDPDPYIDLVFAYVYIVGDEAGKAIDEARRLCGEVFPTCGGAAMPTP